MRPFTVIFLFLILAGMPRAAAAHGEDAVLYVDEAGSDSGLCNEPARPCRTLGHALAQAGKGTQVRVAGGRYDVADVEELFHVVSGVIDVRGGYDRNAGFDTPGVTTTTLSGVPLQYSAGLSERGFHVIVDRKGSPALSAAATDKLLAVHRELKSGATIAPCTGGMAGQLACDKVDLLGHIAFNDLPTRPSAANDIWGFIDLNSGREYVIAGFNTGTAVFDIGDPENPRQVGFSAGGNSVWRDVKIMQRYDNAAGRWRAWAYATTDASTDGLVVIDLSGLPNSIRRVNYQSDFQSSHNVFVTSTEPATGLATGNDTQYLVLAGSDRHAGQVRAYGLADPSSPVLLQGDAIPDSFGAGDRSYAHDVASLTVSDARVSQCPNATSVCNVLLDFNEQNIEVWDMTSAENPLRLDPGRQQYSQRGYVHSGWPSEDGQFMFVQDELDERDFGINTRLRVFSLADLTNPVQVGAWEGPTHAIDHNGFVRGNRYYMSNYSRGLTVLDITAAEAPAASGRIDTYPFSDDAGFVGAWGVYPYFPSGAIAVSDIDSGVYLVRDRTRDVPQGMLAFANASAGAVEGQTALLPVQRTGGSSGDVSVRYEIVHGSAADNDYAPSSGTLDWPDGDSSERAISLVPTNDGTAEGMELLLLRLVSPGGGATLGDRNLLRVHISDPGDSTTLRLYDDAIEATEAGFGRAVIVVQRVGSAVGAASIDFAVSGGDATANDDYQGPASGTLQWPDGDATPQSIAFEILSDGASETAEFFDVAFSNAAGGVLSGSSTARVTIAADPAAGVENGRGGNAGGGGGSGGGTFDVALLLLLGSWCGWLALTRKGVCARWSARGRGRSR